MERCVDVRTFDLLRVAAVYLLDTNVIFELRKPRPHGGVLTWLKAKNNEELFISAMTIGELQAGVEVTRRQDPSKVEVIDRWIDQIANSYQILSIDASIFRQWAKWMRGCSDHLLEDALLAATAHVHRLKVVTRNVKDFERFDVGLINPFETRFS